jgi:hypothetical protein
LFRNLYTRRKAARLEAEARARGEDVDYLTDEAPEAFRHQLIFALGDLGGKDALRAVHGHLMRARGRPRLSRAGGSVPEEDLVNFVGECSTEDLMDMIDAAIQTRLGLAEYGGGGWREVHEFVERIREHLEDHKLAFDVVDQQVVDKTSEELHREVVVPTLTLLHSRPRFADVERQYRDALDELAKRHWGDAITDANAAAEETLRILLGLEHGQLPDLLGQARQRGLFGDVQERWLKQFANGLGALSSMRNVEGDAHHAGTDARSIAWLAVHWAGALIVFFVERDEGR